MGFRSVGCARRTSWSQGKQIYSAEISILSIQMLTESDTLPQLWPSLRARQGRPRMVQGSAPSRRTCWPGVNKRQLNYLIEATTPTSFNVPTAIINILTDRLLPMDAPWSARRIFQFGTYLVHVLLSLAMISNEPFAVAPCFSCFY
jgi:hypothetical protein